MNEGRVFETIPREDLVDAAEELSTANANGKTAAQFILVLQDDDDGHVHIAGVQKPQEYDGRFASHVVGRWLEQHMQEVVMRAKAFADARAAVERGDAPAPQVIDGERERTLILPPGAA